MDEDEKEGREEVCVCVCVWVCDKVSDDVMNEREREKEAEREVWRLWILRSDPHETFKT